MSIETIKGFNMSACKATGGLLGIAATIGAHFFLVVAGSAVPQVVLASGGLCKWEGGAGTDVSCQNEDCMEDGGNMICTEPEPKPPAGIPESMTDGEKFAYTACDLAGASIHSVARWCKATGGTWYVDYSGTGQCAGGSPINSEGSALSAGEQFATMGASCPPTVSFDSGWDFADSWDPFCTGTSGPVYQNSQLVWSQRRQQWTGCGGTGGVTLKFAKTRRLECPEKYAGRTKPNGDLQCYMISSCCLTGMSVELTSGEELHREREYTSADGLVFDRFYRSGSSFRPKGTGPAVAGLEIYWRTSYSRKLMVAQANPYVLAYVQADNGQVTAFGVDGKERQGMNGAAQRLQQVGSNWKVTLANADVENYDSLGRLTSVVARSGYTTALTYASGRLSQISNSYGRTLTLAYDGNGRLASVTLPGGSQLQYSYDNRGRPVTTTFPDGTVRRFHYETSVNEWLLTGITDENSTRYVTYNYDNDGRVANEELAGGVDKRSYTYGYALTSQSATTVYDAYGQAAVHYYKNANGVYKYEGVGNLCADCPNIKGATFDTNGNYASLWDLNDRTTTYIYDLARNLETSRTEGLGAFGAVTSATRTVTTQWHSSYRLPVEQKVYAGATATGAALRTTIMSYDSAGNLLTRTISDPTEGRSLTTTFTYGSQGKVLTENGPRTDVSDVTTYTYYDCSNGNECGRVHTISNPLAHVVTFNSYNAHGQPTQIIDQNGIQRTLSYDSRQRLISIADNSSGVNPEITSFEYWPSGELKRAARPDGTFLAYTYDGARRLIKIEDELGNALSYLLDLRGNQIARNVYDSGGALLRTQQRVYDTLGRLQKLMTASGTDSQATTYGYDASGNQTSTTAPLGRVTAQTFDELGRLRMVTDPSNGNAQVAYDALDTIVSITDPRSLVTSYQHNGIGELKTLTSPDTGSTTHTYDSGGNPLVSTNARGAASVFVHDVLNRVQSVSYKIGTTTDQTFSLVYDQGANSKGRLSSASDANQSLSWSYDELGRVINRTQTVGGFSSAVAYSYVGGAISTFQTPSGQSIAYSRNPSGRASSVTVNGSTLLTNVAYEPFGPVSGWTWGNGALTVRSFDLDGRLTLIDSAGLSTYAFQDDGNLAARSDELAMAYDIALGSTSNVVSATSNRLTTSSGAVNLTYTYDAAGNLTSDGVATYSYNFADRLANVTKNGVATSYTYNVLGQRVRKNANGVITYFTYDESGFLVGEYSGSGGLIQEIVWFEGIPVATLRPKSGGGVDVFYIHSDQLNTPRRVTRPSDNVVVWRWDSDPYGRASADEDPDGDLLTFNFSLRFPGQYFDSESGMHYNYFRDYDPSAGRFIESDPSGLFDGPGTYAYVSGNPLHFLDRDGRGKEGGQSNIGGNDPLIDRSIGPNSTPAQVEEARKKAQDALNKGDMNKKRAAKVRGWLKNIKKTFSRAVCPPLLEESVMFMARESCIKGDMAMCRVFESMGGVVYDTNIM